MPAMPHLPKKKNGTVRVRGSIDAYALENCHIWAMKAQTFFAVKAEIRKAIGKQEGDKVQLTLYLDEPVAAQTDDFLLCLQQEPQLLKHFNKMPVAARNEMTQWIFAAGSEDEKITRMGRALEQLEDAVWAKKK